MHVLMSVMNSDSVNRLGWVFPVDGLERALSESFLQGIPTLLDHDQRQLIGWCRPLGLYVEPGLARMVAVKALSDTQEEYRQVHETYIAYLNAYHERQCAPYREKLSRLLKGRVTESQEWLSLECASVVAPGLARSVARDLFGLGDRDELIGLDDLHSQARMVEPGVYALADTDLVVFAHRFFRRSAFILNTFNRTFLKNLHETSTLSGCSQRIALDPDIVGFAPSFRTRMELAYWWGPKFNEDMSQIKPGVTVHSAEENAAFCRGLSRTEFWWKDAKASREMEIEELPTPERGADKDSTIRCRYIHLLTDASGRNIEHFDGAIRAYPADIYNARMLQHINKSGKHTGYTKLFRVDGHVPIATWISLLASYFVGNDMVGEYLSREQNLETKVPDAAAVPQPEQDPVLPAYSIGDDSGFRVFMTYWPLELLGDPGNTHRINLLDSVMTSRGRFAAVENDAVEFCKILNRHGVTASLAPDVVQIACEDAYLNLPLIEHCGEDPASALRTTVEAATELIAGLESHSAKRVLSLNLSWATETKSVRLSVYGHISPIGKWLGEFGNLMPVRDAELASWASSVRKYLTDSFAAHPEQPRLGVLANETGVLWIGREPLSEQPSCEMRGACRLARAILVSASCCSLCGSDYLTCPHSKLLDGATRLIAEYEPAFAYWTDRLVPFIKK
jgi:hypothetical protein